MAGYFTKLNGYVYSGEYKVKASTTVPNGSFVEPVSGTLTVQPTSAAVTGFKFKVVEKTTVYGLPALRMDVVGVPADGTEVFFVENVFDPLCYNYNEANYTINAGEYVRMHMPELGDQLLISVTSVLYAATSLGDVMVVDAAGTVKADPT